MEAEFHLVAQGYEDPVGDVLSVYNSCIDDISDKQVDIEKGKDDRGEDQRHLPLGEEPQGEVFQFTGRRQRASVQDGDAQLGGHDGHFPLCFFTVATQVHL